MKCYNHIDTDAVAICKNCNKGLCKDCAVELPNGITCKGDCENEAKIMNELIAKSKTTPQETAQSYKRFAIIYILLGLVFALIGIDSLLSRDKATSIIMIPMGLIFLLGAFFSYSTGKKLNKT